MIGKTQFIADGWEYLRVIFRRWADSRPARSRAAGPNTARIRVEPLRAGGGPGTDSVPLRQFRHGQSQESWSARST